MTDLDTVRPAAIVVLVGLAICPPTAGRAGDLKQIEGLTLHEKEKGDRLLFYLLLVTYARMSRSKYLYCR